MNHTLMVETNFVTTLLRDISSWPDELRDKMHFVTSVCVNRYVDRHEHMSRSYTSKSRSYILSRTCADHEPICREHPTPPIWAVASAPGMKEHACSCSFAYVFVFYTFRSIRVRVLSSLGRTNEDGSKVRFRIIHSHAIDWLFENPFRRTTWHLVLK